MRETKEPEKSESGSITLTIGPKSMKDLGYEPADIISVRSAIHDPTSERITIPMISKKTWQTDSDISLHMKDLISSIV